MHNVMVVDIVLVRQDLASTFIQTKLDSYRYGIEIGAVNDYSFNCQCYRRFLEDIKTQVQVSGIWLKEIGEIKNGVNKIS